MLGKVLANNTMKNSFVLTVYLSSVREVSEAHLLLREQLPHVSVQSFIKQRAMESTDRKSAKKK